MTSSFDPNQFGNGNGAGHGAGNGAARPGVYSRFIPREELSGFAAWKPGSFGDDGSRKPQAAPPAPDPVADAKREQARQAAEQVRLEGERIEQLRLSREGGYQDGYRDGLAALEQFKQSYAAQTSTQVAALVQQLGTQLDALEQGLAQRVAGIALDIARQVVRSELTVRPQAVVAVAQEALSTLLVSARHITLHLNPADQALVASGCAELLAARHVRLVVDAQIERGGCRVESDIGTTDARIATRWQRANAALGRDSAWAVGDEVAAADALSAAAAPADRVVDDPRTEPAAALHASDAPGPDAGGAA